MLFVATMMASVLTSLIPAGVIKGLMWGIFGRSVSYLKVLAIVALTYVAMSMTIVGMGYETAESLDSLPDWLSITIAVVTFVFQALVLALTVTDKDGDLVEVGGWIIVLLLQYVVYLVIGLLIIFL